MATQRDFKTERERKIFLKKINSFLIKYFKFFVLFLVVLVLVLGYFFLLGPKYKEIQTMIKHSQQQRQEIFLSKQKKLNRLKDYIKSYEKFSSQNKEKINYILPQKYNQEQLFSELNHLVEKNNLILKNISVKGGKTKVEFGQTKKDIENQAQNETLKAPAGVQKYAVEMSILGTNYYSLKNFLYTLENNLKLLDITKLNFSPSSKTLNLTLMTYYLK